MSSVVSGYRRQANEHFEPDAELDLQAQRALRGKLEAIDYTAFTANKEVLGLMVKRTDPVTFQRLGVAAAQARGQWIAAAVAATELGHALTPMQVDKLSQLRRGYEELAEAYDALRRLVERGYVSYTAPTKG
ncbi:MAG TPA: hypothetical protein VMU59_09175 [Caulobacteraceae bacterium]|nr:hypothetical protein [Caulobacteraceae bacterium]